MKWEIPSSPFLSSALPVRTHICTETTGDLWLSIRRTFKPFFSCIFLTMIYISPMSDNQFYGIYIHIPYCIQRCLYCDFATYEQSQIFSPQEYIQLLLEEMRQKSNYFKPQDDELLV